MAGEELILKAKSFEWVLKFLGAWSSALEKQLFSYVIHLPPVSPASPFALV